MGAGDNGKHGQLAVMESSRGKDRAILLHPHLEEEIVLVTIPKMLNVRSVHLNDNEWSISRHELQISTINVAS